VRKKDWHWEEQRRERKNRHWLRRKRARRYFLLQKLLFILILGIMHLKVLLRIHFTKI